MDRLKSWNRIVLLTSVLLWATFYLGVVFMYVLALLNIITSIKIYNKNKIAIIIYWILASVNLYFIYDILYSHQSNSNLDNSIFMLIIMPYILAIYLNYVLHKTH